MSYIIKKNEPLVNLKLTDTGRKNLASGKLTFTYFGLGDGEMDYSHDSPTNLNILRPTDNQHDIQYPVPSEGTAYKLPISILTSLPNIVHTRAKERGFFIFDEDDASIEPQVNESLTLVCDVTGYTTGFTVSNEIQLTYWTGSTTNDYSNKVKVGDYMFVKFKPKAFLDNYGQSDNINIAEYSMPYMMYQITEVNGTDSIALTGVTTGDTTYTLDRDLPKGEYAYIAFIYPGVDTIKDYYDEETPIAYWSNGLLDFSSNNSQVPQDVPVWNMNIITIEDFIGVDNTIYKSKYEAVSRDYWGTAINYDYMLNNVLPKVGVIHYTNNTVSNWYAEGFYKGTLKLKIPYLMWHKSQGTLNDIPKSIGYTFICGTELKISAGNVRYYDLIDQEEKPTVVGKVFPDQKIVVIEHQELLAALSYKGNRNWTLPKPVLNLTEPGLCAEANIGGALQANECIHITYLLMDTNGITGIHCEDYASISNTTQSPKDVSFQFPVDNTNPNYTEFGYLRNYYLTNHAFGFRTNNILLLWQKTPIGGVPDAANWNYYNVNQFLGGNGCLGFVSNLCNDFELFSEIPTLASGSTYLLAQQEIGDVIVSYNGSILKEASTESNLGVNGNFWRVPLTQMTSNLGTRLIRINPALNLGGGNILQFHYLVGETSTASTFIEDYTVPPGGVVSTNYQSGIYLNNGVPSLALPTQPNNNVVYLFYNGILISSSNYGVYTTGGTADRRVQLTFTPTPGSTFAVFYLDNSGQGQTVQEAMFSSANVAALKVNISADIIKVSTDQVYDLNDFITLASKTENTHSFGDETFFYGNVDTEIKATIFKTLITCNVLPNKFINTANPTFNPNQDKVAFTEIGVYDEDEDLVAIGKFSEPLVRKYNSDMLIIQATIDF